MTGMVFNLYHQAHNEYEKALKREEYQSFIFMRSYEKVKRKRSCKDAILRISERDP